MTGFRRAALAVALPLIIAIPLAGCFAGPVLIAAGGALVAASELYCAALTEQAKQGARDRLTGGRRLVHCPVEGR